MRKLVFLWIALVAVSLQALANDKVSFTASAPDAVAVGDQFRLAYTVTTQKREISVLLLLRGLTY